MIFSRLEVQTWWNSLNVEQRKSLSKQYYKKAYAEATMKMSERINSMYDKEVEKGNIIKKATAQSRDSKAI